VVYNEISLGGIPDRRLIGKTPLGPDAAAVVAPEAVGLERNRAENPVPGVLLPAIAGHLQGQPIAKNCRMHVFRQRFGCGAGFKQHNVRRVPVAEVLRVGAYKDIPSAHLVGNSRPDMVGRFVVGNQR